MGDCPAAVAQGTQCARELCPITTINNNNNNIILISMHYQCQCRPGPSLPDTIPIAMPIVISILHSTITITSAKQRRGGGDCCPGPRTGPRRPAAHNILISMYQNKIDASSTAHVVRLPATGILGRCPPSVNSNSRREFEFKLS